MSQSTALVAYRHPNDPLCDAEGRFLHPARNAGEFITEQAKKGEEVIQMAYVGYNPVTREIVQLHGTIHEPLEVAAIAAQAIWRNSNANLALGRIVASYWTTPNFRFRDLDVEFSCRNTKGGSITVEVSKTIMRFDLLDQTLAPLILNKIAFDVFDWARLEGRSLTAKEEEAFPDELRQTHSPLN